jgi:hypothetical protein|nr:MAG TPA: hypothetical protein [Caudoviricetes sp.]
MFKYTYIIEYNIICKDNRETKIIRYSSDYELTSFVANRETIANTIRSRAQLFYILFNGKILYNQFLDECFSSNLNFQLKVNILKCFNNRQIGNRNVSAALEKYLYLISRGAFLLYGVKGEEKYEYDFLYKKNMDYIEEVKRYKSVIDFESSYNYILIKSQVLLYRSKRKALEYCIDVLMEMRDILIVNEYEKIKLIEEDSENINNGKWRIKQIVINYVSEIVLFARKITNLFDCEIEKNKEFFNLYLDDVIHILNETLDEIKPDEVITPPLSFEGNEAILEGHFKFSRDNERYLFDYLNELYNIFNIGDKKLCKQNRLGGICAIIYDSKIITNCNTFSECMRLLCGYWKRETPKDCRLNKYQDAKQELLDKHRILNEIPRK